MLQAHLQVLILDNSQALSLARVVYLVFIALSFSHGEDALVSIKPDKRLYALNNNRTFHQFFLPELLVHCLKLGQLCVQIISRLVGIPDANELAILG